MAYVSSYLHRSCRLPRCCCVLDGQEAPYRPRALSFSAASGLRYPMGSRGIGAGKSVYKYVNDPARYWDQFYRRHDNKFFKDRHYLVKDWGRYFSETNEKDGPFGEPKVVLEVGCGAGNTLFPLLATFPSVFLHACDISPHAISLIKSKGAFRSERVNAFVCDVTLDNLRKEIPRSSVDIVTLYPQLKCLWFSKTLRMSLSQVDVYFSGTMQLRTLLRRWIRAAFRCQGIHDFRQIMCQRSHQEDLGVRNA